MSRKLEIRTRMQELQKEFSELNAEMKEIDSIEKKATLRERYKEYQFKVGTYGYKVDAEDKIVEATDEDREDAGRGKSGLVYTGFDGRDGFGFIMMRDRSEYARVVRVCEIIDAVEHLASDKVQDKEPHIKVILGEAPGSEEAST